MITYIGLKKIILKSSLCLFSSVIIGTLLLFAVFLLSDAKIQANVISSADIFENENAYPVFVKEDMYIGKADNFTDCIMLTNAMTRNKNEPFYRTAMNGTYIASTQDYTPLYAFLCYTKGETELYKLQDYPRYWHGYLIFLRPLLMFFNYAQIRLINRVLLCIVTAIALLCIAIKTRFKYTIAYLASLLALSPVVLPYSMQNSTVFYITNLAVITFCLFKSRIKELCLFFLMVGIVTAYFDFLTYPTLTLGIPLTLTVIEITPSLKNKLLVSVINIIKYSVFWAIGYLGMWFFKWVIGSIILHTNIFTNAFDAVAERTSGIGLFDISLFSTIFDMLWHTLKYISLPAMLILVISLILLIICRNQPLQRKNHFIMYFMVSVIPFVWYLAVRQHTVIHTFFTFRSLGTFYFALFSCLLSWFDLRTFKRNHLHSNSSVKDKL